MFYQKYIKQRLSEVQPQSKIPFEQFKEWVNSETSKHHYLYQSKSTNRYSIQKLYITRSIDRMYLRQSQEPTLEGECIKMSNDALLYPDSQVLVRNGYKLWVHDLSVADFACFKDEEIELMAKCLRRGKWAIEKYEEKND